MKLNAEDCIPCLDGGPTLTPTEISELLTELPGWEVIDGHHLRKVLSFPDFNSALSWICLAGAVCEQQGHHADFKLGWGYAEAVIFTHKADGLTRSDGVLASRFDAIDQRSDQA